jgi:adenylylsulfate kinase-like enzyme
MTPEEDEETSNAAALRTRLEHVYWIGGGSGGGKSTIARRIADQHGLDVYATDHCWRDWCGRWRL